MSSTLFRSDALWKVKNDAITPRIEMIAFDNSVSEGRVPNHADLRRRPADAAGDDLANAER